jgi:FkbM family methyltransferase
VVLSNAFRTFIGYSIIALVHYPWRISEKLLRRSFPVKEHYLIMSIFRRLVSSFPVTIKYRNPLSEDNSIITLRVDLCENNQLAYFRTKGTYELEWIRLVVLAMADAKSFIDVGANIGIFALTVAQAFPDRRVVAIEPLPKNYSILEKTIYLNGLTNVEALKAAVTSNGSPARFFVNPIHDGGGSIIEPTEYRTGDVRLDVARYQENHPGFNPTVEVEGLQLDKVITDSSVVKIDVEGAEISALRSVWNALSVGLVDVMVVEAANDTIDEVISLADGASFDCFIYGQWTPIACGFRFKSRAGNVLWLRRQSPVYKSMMARLWLT